MGYIQSEPLRYFSNNPINAGDSVLIYSRTAPDMTNAQNYKAFNNIYVANLKNSDLILEYGVGRYKLIPAGTATEIHEAGIDQIVIHNKTSGTSTGYIEVIYSIYPTQEDIGLWQYLKANIDPNIKLSEVISSDIWQD